MPSRKQKGKNPQQNKPLKHKILRKKEHKKGKRKSERKKANRLKGKNEPKIESIKEKLERSKQEQKINDAELAASVKDDLQFFQTEGGGAFNFIEGMKIEQKEIKPRARKLRKERKAAKNQPPEWENIRTKKSWKTQQHNFLPIKTLDGTIIEGTIEEPELPEPGAEENLQEKEDGDIENEGEEEEEEEEEEEGKEGTSAVLNEENLSPELVKAKLYHERQERIQKAKEDLALIAAQILEDPEHQFHKLTELRQRCVEEKDNTIKKYFLLSEVAIFKDLIPGYTIRLPTPIELTVQVSKVVAQLRAYESALLNSYQNFLRYLETQIRRSPKKFFSSSGAQNNMGAIYARCIGTLLVSVPHFNFRANLISAIVPLINVDNEQISDIAKESIENLFKQENQSEASLDATRKIVSLIKAKNFNVKPRMITTFLALPLTTELPEGTDVLSGYTPKRLSKRAKKKEKVEKQLQRDMKEAMAEQDKDRRRQIQTETLKAIFFVYFKILKSPDISHLLPYVLEGLAKFSHLINVDVLLNLLDILREMMKRSNLDPISKLHCSITAFQTLRMQGEALNVDLRDFFNYFYSMLFNLLPTVTTNESLIPVVIRCFTLMFQDNKQLSLDRVAAFIQRLLMMSLYVSPPSAIAIVTIIKNLFIKYPKTQQLLDNEYKGNGIYQSDIDDPEHCNAFASTAWEFVLLKNHVHPVLNHLSRLVCSMSQIEGNHKPEDLYHFYRPNDKAESSGKGLSYCYPHIPLPQRHELEKKIEREEKRVKNKSSLVKAWWVQPPSNQSTDSFLNSLKKEASFTEEVNGNNFDFKSYFEEMENDVTIIT